MALDTEEAIGSLSFMQMKSRFCLQKSRCLAGGWVIASQDRHENFSRNMLDDEPARRNAFERLGDTAKVRADHLVLGLELERLRFQLAKARREAFGQSAETGSRIGQVELALENVEETLAALRAAAEMTVEGTTA